MNTLVDQLDELGAVFGDRVTNGTQTWVLELDERNKMILKNEDSAGISYLEMEFDSISIPGLRLVKENDSVRMNSDLRRIAKQVHKTATEKGWHDREVNTSEFLLNLHGEVSEAMEADKKGIMHEVIDEKPEGVVPEIADVIIRILDWAEEEGLTDSLISSIWEKEQYNQKRTYRHGGKAY